MAFLITTTGTPAAVVINDLGKRTFVHPTGLYDLENEYSINELINSGDLQSAISGSEINVVDEYGNTILELTQLLDMQSSYNKSITNPKILTNTTLEAINIRRGSSLDTDYIITGQNGAGTDTFAVTGLGNVIAADYNGVSLNDSGASTNYLDESGNYSAPEVAADGVSIIGDGTPLNPLVAVGGSSGNLLLTGGASYSGTGLIFDVSALTYVITGVNYTAISTSVTLNSGDPSNGRFDAIVVDELQVISVIQGTPSATPVTPTIGGDQVLVQYILVGQNATTPNITTENVYLESTNGWANKGTLNNPTNTTADFAATTPVPFQGSECADIDSGRYSSNRGIFFSTNSPVGRQHYVVLSIRVYLTEDLTNVPGIGARRLIVRGYGDNTGTGTPGNYIGYRYLDQHGLDYNLLNTWQLVTIPTVLMVSNLTTSTVGMFVFGLTGNDSPTFTSSNYAMDDIKLQTGYGPSTSTSTIDILENDTVVSPTARLNFKDTATTTALVTNDPLTNTVDVEISATGGSNLYTVDGTITVPRIATIQKGLTWTGSTETRTTNTRTIKEVISDADIGTTLAANTTYVIRGKVTLTQTIQVVNVGSEVIGLNRDVDEIEWRGTGSLFFVRDQNFSVSNLKLSSDTSGNNIIAGNNIGAGYNFARTKVLTFLNCQFRGTYDVMDIDGFDLVDINNCLFFYIKATNWGLRFRDTSKIEITSCELIRWFDETNLANSLGAWSAGSYVIGDIVTDGPTFYKALTNNSVQPSTSIGVDWDATGYANVAMIELQANNVASFGAVNINGCIVHPQQTQVGIDIDSLSTTGFGTISSNAFISVGLTTGKVFLPEASSLPDYSSTATGTYDIFANQGLLNTTSGVLMTFIGNTNDTDLVQDVPLVIETDGLAVAQSAVRYTVSGAGRCTYTGSKQVYVSLHASLSYDKQQNGTDTFHFYFYKNGVLLPQSKTTIEAEANATNIGSTSMTYGTLMTQNDYIEIYVENITSGDDIIITDLQFLIRE